MPEISARRRTPSVVALSCVLLWFLVGSPLHAADDQAQAPAPTPAVTPQDTAGKKCTWACLKWTKSCNVDPRGVYKCRRTCANFAEVCE
jgi:hypothetical protein